jgi:arsenate reductase
MSKTTITVYGIPNCDSVKKARLWLKHVSWDVLVNRKGTTWRKLDPALQTNVVDSASARALMLEHASVVKRPILVKGQTVIVGVNPEAWTRVVG